MKMRTPNRLLWLAALGIALQAIVPVGYMPAPIAGGLPFVLCPGGLSGAAFFIADTGLSAHGAGHEQQHEHSDGDAEPAAEWQFCPFGAVFGGATLAAESGVPFLFPEAESLAADTDPFVRSALTPRTWRARAPPTDRPIDV